ncbi:MAG TPA: glycosyltransferase family 9 protein, partial [Bryobacteraceae bacterium]|nr:glycosyltransferase family 9 protein [Bryobacteraceae bacterium]
MFAGINWIDEIVEYYPEDLAARQEAVRFLSMIRAYRFDVLVDLSNDVAKMRVLLRNMVFAKLSGVTWAAGWSLNTIRVALQAQSDHIDFPNEVERLLADVRASGIPAQDEAFPMAIAEADEQRANRLLADLGLPLDRPLIAVAPGAKRPGSCWPRERFEAAGKELAQHGYTILVVG